MSLVIVITGPIASGKSTVARELAHQLERSGVRVAVIDLDLVHDRRATDPGPAGDGTWTRARREAATVANGCLEDGVAVVVAEGSFNTPGDRAAFRDHLTTGIDPLYVTLHVSYEEALRRARGDPTRGRSRDPGFLGPYFETVGNALAHTPATDLAIDTERMTPTLAAAQIMARLRPTRRSGRGHGP
jgi:predicted kinase